MEERTKAFYDQAAKRTMVMGPYYAIGVIQGMCENTWDSAATKIENIKYFLDRLLEEQGKEERHGRYETCEEVRVQPCEAAGGV